MVGVAPVRVSLRVVEQAEQDHHELVTLHTEEPLEHEAHAGHVAPMAFAVERGPASGLRRALADCLYDFWCDGRAPAHRGTSSAGAQG
jgi:hypothetical protein